MKTCLDVQSIHKFGVDGEYWLSLPDGNLASVYCYNLTGTTKHFISLAAGPLSNMATYYHGQLSASGDTYFYKVGLNIAVKMSFRNYSLLILLEGKFIAYEQNFILCIFLVFDQSWTLS